MAVSLQPSTLLLSLVGLLIEMAIPVHLTSITTFSVLPPSLPPVAVRAPCVTLLLTFIPLLGISQPLYLVNNGVVMTQLTLVFFVLIHLELPLTNTNFAAERVVAGKGFYYHTRNKFE